MRYFVYWLAFFILSSTSWTLTIFGPALIEQILFQLVYVVHDKLVFPVMIMHLFVRDCVIAPIMLTLLVYLLESIFTWLFKNFSNNPSKFVFLLKNYFFKYLHIYLFIFSLGYFEAIFSVSSFAKNQLAKDEKNKYYISAEDIRITSKNPKNLILIYAESFEQIYENEAIYNINLLENISFFGGEYFKKFYQLPGTGWTMAGILATQCGEYLTLNFLENKHACLGDVLKKHGYHNAYMQGASLEFTHTGEFLKNHGYHELFGREEWKEKGYADLNEWGLYDVYLFEEAKEKLKQLHSQNQPFNLTILTVDTHAPFGYISNHCKKEGVSSYTDIVSCSSNSIADFIKFIIDNGYLDNTNIVILGDHLFPIHKDFALTSNERTIFNKFIAKNYPIKIRDDVNHFDMYPSILKFIGFDVEGNELALGKSAFK